MLVAFRRQSGEFSGCKMSTVTRGADTTRICVLIKSLLQSLRSNSPQSNGDLESLRYSLWCSESNSKSVLEESVSEHIHELVELWQTKLESHVDTLLVDVIVLLCIRFQLLKNIPFSLWQSIIDFQVSDQVPMWTKLADDLMDVESNSKYMSLLLLHKALKDSNNGVRGVLTGKNYVDEVGNSENIIADYTWYMLAKAITTELGARRCLAHFKNYNSLNCFNVKQLTLNGNSLNGTTRLVSALNDQIFYVWENNSLKCLIDGRSLFDLNSSEEDSSINLCFKANFQQVILLDSTDTLTNLVVSKSSVIGFVIEPNAFSQAAQLISILARSHRKISVTSSPIVINDGGKEVPNYTLDGNRKEMEVWKSSVTGHHATSSQSTTTQSFQQSSGEDLGADRLWSTSPSQVVLTLTQPNSIGFRYPKSTSMESFNLRNQYGYTTPKKTNQLKLSSCSADEFTLLGSNQYTKAVLARKSARCAQKHSLDFNSQEGINDSQMQSIPDSDVYATDFAPRFRHFQSLVKRVRLEKCRKERVCSYQNDFPDSSFETSLGKSDANDNPLTQDTTETSCLRVSSPLTNAGNKMNSKYVIREIANDFSNESEDPLEGISTGCIKIFESIQQFSEEIILNMESIRDSIAQTESDVRLFHKKIHQMLQ